MGHAESRSQNHGLDAPESVLRWRCRVRSQEHHLGGRARSRSCDLNRPAVLRRGRQCAFGPAGRRDKVISLRDIKAEVELGYDPDLALKEAERCLNCDVQTVFTGQLCIECDACVDICPMDCITFTENGEEPEL